jgi:hypothetical protein
MKLCPPHPNLPPISNFWFYNVSKLIKVVDMSNMKNLLKQPEQGLLLLFEIYFRRCWKDYIDDLLPLSAQDNVFLQAYAEFFSTRTLLQVSAIAGFIPHLLFDIRQKFHLAHYKQYYEKKKIAIKAFVDSLDADGANWLGPCFSRNGVKTQGRFDPDKVPDLFDLPRNDVIQFLLAYNIIRSFHKHLFTYLTECQSKRLNLAGKTLFMNPIEFRNMMCIVFSNPDFVEDLKAILKHYKNFVPNIPSYRMNPTVNELRFYYCTKKLSNNFQQDMENIAVIPAEESQSISPPESDTDNLDNIPFDPEQLKYLDNVAGELPSLE